MQLKNILFTFTVLNSIDCLAFPKRGVELRNRKDDIVLNKRSPKQSKKGQLPDIVLNKRSPKQTRNGRESEVRQLPDVVLNKRSPKQTGKGIELRQLPA